MIALWELHHVTGEPRGAVAALRSVLAAAKRSKIPEVVLIGAGALAAHGAPRYSEDIDFLLPHSDARRLVRALHDAGFSGPPDSRDVYLYTMTSPSGMEVDLLGAIEQLYLDAIESARQSTFLGTRVRVPSPELFVLLKLRAAEGDPARELRHLGDVQDLLRVRKVDLRFVRSYVAVNEPDLGPMLAKIDAAASRRPSKR